MIAELVLAALPVVRRALLIGLVSVVMALAVALACAAGLVWCIVESPPAETSAWIAFSILVALPALTALVAAGGTAAFAAALEGPPRIRDVARTCFGSLPTLAALAVPGLLGIATFGASVLCLFATIIAGPRSSMSSLVLVVVAVFTAALVVACAHIWVRMFAAPACAAVVEGAGFLAAHRFADAAIARRRWLLVASTLLPLAPLIVTTPDSVATRSVASLGLSPAPILALRGVVGFAAVFATVFLSCALPVVAYALAAWKKIRGLGEGPESAP